MDLTIGKCGPDGGGEREYGYLHIDEELLLLYG